LRPQALGAWLPTVSVEASRDRNNKEQATDGSSEFAYSHNTTSVGLSLTQPVTRGGSEFAALRGAEAQIATQRAALRATEQDVLSRTVAAYMDALVQQQVLALRQESVASYRHILDNSQRLLAVGDRTIGDLAQVQTQLALAEAGQAGARSGLASAGAGFRQLSGLTPETLTLPAEPPGLPSRQEELEALVARDNPALRQATFDERAASDEVDRLTGQLLPTVALRASVQDTRTTGTSHDVIFPDSKQRSLTVGVTLSVPLYQSGAEYARIRQAKDTASQKRLAALAVERQVLAEAVQAWQRLDGARQTAAAYQRQVQAATLAVAQARRGLEAGERTVFESLAIEQQLTDARIALAQSDTVIQSYQVLRTAGRLSAESLGLPVTRYDPEADYQRAKWRIIGLDPN
jgi:TolC family type I secretion outer membrane protein